MMRYLFNYRLFGNHRSETKLLANLSQYASLRRGIQITFRKKFEARTREVLEGPYSKLT